MATILITGGAGFIGSHVVDALAKQRHRLVIIDDLSSGKKEYLNKDAVFYCADICDEATLDRIFENEKIEYIFHFAAQIDVRKSAENPRADAKINVDGTLNLLECAAKYNIKKFIFASSGGALYGEADEIPTPESYKIDATKGPSSPYGIAKYCAEQYIRFFNKTKGIPFGILRYGNVYGPRQDHFGESGVIAIFISRLLQGSAPTIYGDGNQARDFIFVEDAVSAAIKIFESPSSGTYNIGTGVETSINKIFYSIQKKIKSSIAPIYEEKKSGDVFRSCLDCARAKKNLLWEPATSLEEGIEKTIAYFKNMET